MCSGWPRRPGPFRAYVRCRGPAKEPGYRSGSQGAKRVDRLVTAGNAQVCLSEGGSMIGALILGLVAGALARLVIPNDALEHLEGWKSWLATIVLGLVGALLGWLIFTGLFGIGDTDVFDLGGIIGAIIGSILVLVGVGWFLRRTGR